MRGPGQIFPAAIVLALIVNAQCVASCSVQAVLASPTSVSGKILSHPKGPGGCPHHQSPDSQGKSENPCPNPATQSNDARWENNPGANAVALPVSLAAERGLGFYPAPADRPAVGKAPDRPAQPVHSAVLVLRV